MSDEAGLLLAIAETPDDLTLRMVYADWCEEHGRAARSALIRGQCLLDPILGTMPSVDHHDARYLLPFDLSQELRESVLEAFRPLIEAMGCEWDGIDGMASARSRWYAVRRGFVERLNLTGLSQLTHWLEHAPTILVRTPLLTLNVARQTYPGMSDPDEIPAEIVRRLVAVEGAETIRELDLSHHHLGQVACRALAEDGGRLRLTTLRLSGWSLTLEQSEELRARFGSALALQPAPSDDEIPF